MEDDGDGGAGCTFYNLIRIASKFVPASLTNR